MSKVVTPALANPDKHDTSIKRVAILFAGGPAPAANAVISTAAVAFLRNGMEVVGIKHGYSALDEYSPEKPLQEDEHYIFITHKTLKRTRNSQGILIGTSRTNPGKDVSHPSAYQPGASARGVPRIPSGRAGLVCDTVLPG